MKSLKVYLTFFIAITMLFSACNSSKNTMPTGGDSTYQNQAPKKHMNKTTKGGLIGAGGGALLGGVIGAISGNTAAGALIGAAVGGTTGAIIGRRMDKQAAELQRDMQNAKVERVGEGIKITFSSGILFNTNSADLRPQSRDDISALAATLKKYGDTNVIVEGHTDNTGSDAINQPLSVRRADAVANYAKSLGVESSRFTTQGWGSSKPVADNSTEAGRQANRRVEIAILANEKLKKAAERGDIK